MKDAIMLGAVYGYSQPALQPAEDCISDKQGWLY